MSILAVLCAVLSFGLTTLAAGIPVHEVVSSGGVRRFRLDLAAAQVVDCRVDQGEHDLTTSFIGPDMASAATFDARERGVEWISFAAGEAGGTYVLEVRPVAADAMRIAFVVTCDAPRPSRPTDADRFEAERLDTDARKLSRTGDRTSLPTAIDKRRRALELWHGIGEREPELATRVALGDAYLRSSQYAQAEETYKQALDLSRALGDERTEAEVLTNLAVNGRLSGELFDAFGWSQRALDLWRKLRLRSGLAIALTNRGVLLREAGEYDAAQQHHAQALAIFRELHDNRALAYGYNNRAIVFEDLDQLERALQDLARAITLFQQVGETRAEGRAFVSQARVQLRLGQVRAARASIVPGLERIRQSPDGLALADAVEQEGRILAADGHADEARERFEEALSLYRRVASRKGESDAFQDLALLDLAAGDVAAATPLLDQAQALRQATGLRSLQAETLIAIARADRLRGDPALARQHAAEAVDILERLHTDVIARELRSSHFGVIRRYYAEYIDDLVALHRERPDAGFAGEAFELSERAKARGLIDLLHESRANVAAHVDPALLQRERELRQALNFWSWTLWQQSDKATSLAGTRAEVEVQRLLAAHDEIAASILRADQHYRSLIQPAPLSLDDIRHDVLDHDTVLIEYSLGTGTSYGWAVTDTSVTMIELPDAATIERHARRLYRLISHQPERAYDAARESAIAREKAWLHRVLVQPLAETLDRRRVLVVPDRALHYVPFALLLPRTRELVTLPSATVLALLRQDLAGRQPPSKLLAVFADPVFDPADVRVWRATHVAPTSTAVRPVSRLGHARDEAKRVLAVAPPGDTRLAVDFEASRERVMDGSLADFRYLHFATHALRDDRRPELSAIVLSLVGRDGKKQDGFLRLHDIYNLRLRADLVVLSACETGSDATVNGEGQLGLARGFFYAGAARVLATLWKVDDEATAEMMVLFYRALFGHDHPTPAAALASAQAELRANPRFASPYYWAAFVLAGEP